MKRLFACIIRVCQEVLQFFIFVARSLLLLPVILLRYAEKLPSKWLVLQQLWPLGLYLPSLKARLERRSGNLQQSALIWSRILGDLEKRYSASKVPSSALKQVLTVVYSELAENYFITGYIDDAALMVIRAHQIVGLDSLPNFSNFDVRAAHIVKTGIAASKLIEGRGFSSVQLNAHAPDFENESELLDSGESKSKISDGAQLRQRRFAKLDRLTLSPFTDRSKEGLGKVIPFNLTRRNSPS